MIESSNTATRPSLRPEQKLQKAAKHYQMYSCGLLKPSNHSGKFKGTSTERRLRPSCLFEIHLASLDSCLETMTDQAAFELKHRKSKKAPRQKERFSCNLFD
jgi:hypothetical protein